MKKFPLLSNQISITIDLTVTKKIKPSKFYSFCNFENLAAETIASQKKAFFYASKVNTNAQFWCQLVFRLIDNYSPQLEKSSIYPDLLSKHSRNKLAENSGTHKIAK